MKIMQIIQRLTTRTRANTHWERPTTHTEVLDLSSCKSGDEVWIHSDGGSYFVARLVKD